MQQNGPNQWLVGWKRAGGHYVTSAGVNSEDYVIGLSDPFFDNVEAGVCPGIIRGPNHNHPLGHNDGIGASHDVYNINDSTACSPGGVWELDHAFWHNPGLQTEFMNQNGDTIITSVQWPCQFPPAVGMLFSEIEYAVIVSPYEGTPDINVIPDSLTYAQLFNTTQVYTDQIIICNTGNAPLRIDSISCDISFASLGAHRGLLAAGQCDSIDVTLNTTGINPGIYTGSCHVYSNDPDEAIVHKPRLRVTVTAPDISVAPASVQHNQDRNVTITYTSDFTIYNNGNATLNYTATNTLAWITLGGMNGSVPPSSSDAVDITVNTNSIPAGNYVDSVTIVSNDPDTPILHRPQIRMTVTAPDIDITPNLVSHAQSRDVIISYPNDFSIFNHGDDTLTCSATNTLSWIIINSMPSSILPNHAAQVGLSINTNGIPAGNYSDTVVVTSNDPDTPVLHKPVINIRVTAPDISVSPDSIYLSQVSESYTIYEDAFAVSNSGDDTLQCSASNTLSWITLVGPASNIAPNGSSFVDVQVSTYGIIPGVYVDSVAIISNDPDTPTLYRPKIVIEVTGGQSECDIVAGDANSNGTFNGIDVTYSVNYLKGIGPIPPDSCDCPPYLALRAAADANGNCSYNGIDVTYSVNYLKGIGPAPRICPNCPTITAAGRKTQNPERQFK